MATRTVTKRQAERALAEVARQLGGVPTGPDAARYGDGPELNMTWDWPGQPTPTILLESSSFYDWAPRVDADRIYQVAGVRAEAFAGYALCLYPASDYDVADPAAERRASEEQSIVDFFTREARANGADLTPDLLAAFRHSAAAVVANGNGRLLELIREDVDRRREAEARVAASPEFAEDDRINAAYIEAGEAGRYDSIEGVTPPRLTRWSPCPASGCEYTNNCPVHGWSPILGPGGYAICVECGDEVEDDGDHAATVGHWPRQPRPDGAR